MPAPAQSVPRPASGPWRFGPPLGLALLSLPVVFFGLDRYSVVNGDEAIYHAMARRMLETGELWVLRFDGEERVYDTLTHAPLFLWAKLPLIAALGDGLLAMRLLSALFGLASVLATWALVRRLAGDRAAFLAGLVQLSTYQLVYLHGARTGEMEPLLTFFFTLAALLFLRALATGRGFVPHHLCLVALANLKLAIVAVPILAELAWFAAHPASRGRLRPWIAAAAWILPLGLAWHAVQVALHWEALPEIAGTLGDQAAGRPRGPAAQLLHHARFYGEQLLAGTLPYTPLYPLAVAGVLWRARGPERARWVLVALYAAAVVVFFFSLRLQRPWYLVPALPFLAAFLGAWLDRLLAHIPGWPTRLALVVAIAFVAVVRVPVFAIDPFVERAVVAWPAPQVQGLAGLGVWATAAAVAVLAGVVIAAAARSGDALRLGAPVVAGFVAIAGLRVAAPLARVSHTSEMAALRQEIDAGLAAGRPRPRVAHLVQGGPIKARYYFGDDFEVRPAPPELRRFGVSLVLRARESPSARSGPYGPSDVPPGAPSGPPSSEAPSSKAPPSR